MILSSVFWVIVPFSSGNASCSWVAVFNVFLTYTIYNYCRLLPFCCFLTHFSTFDNCIYVHNVLCIFTTLPLLMPLHCLQPIPLSLLLTPSFCLSDLLLLMAFQIYVNHGTSLGLVVLSCGGAIFGSRGNLSVTTKWEKKTSTFL